MVEAVSGAIIAGGITSVANFLSSENNRTRRTLERNTRLQNELRQRIEEGTARFPRDAFTGGLAEIFGRGKPQTPVPTTPPPPGAPLPPTGEGPPEIFPDVEFLPPFGRGRRGPDVGGDEFEPSIAEKCAIDPVFARVWRVLCEQLGVETDLPEPPRGSLEMPTGRRRQPPRFEGLFEARPGVFERRPPPQVITDEELAELFFRGPIPRPRTPVEIPRLPTRRQLLEIIRRVGRIVFPGQRPELEEIPELFPVRLPEIPRRSLPQPRRAPETTPARTPTEPLPETVTVPQTTPPAAPSFPRARTPVLGRISLAAGVGLVSAVGINLLQRQTTRLGARIGEPFAPTAPPAPPVPPLPPGLQAAGQRAQLRTRQRECQEVKRRRRRKGKCREGFFEELPGRTRFTTWREVDCVTRRNVRSNPLRGLT